MKCHAWQRRRNRERTYTQTRVVELIIAFVNDLSWHDLFTVAWCRLRGRRWMR